MIWGVLPCDILTALSLRVQFPWKIRQLLEHGSTAIDPAVAQTWYDLGDSPPCFSREIQRAAFAILWMGLRGEREGLPSMLATSFAEAAGVAGRQKWGLVLSSSARVSQVTYQTVVGCGTLSWSHSMERAGTSVNLSPMRDRNEVASSLFFGMFHVRTRRMLSRTLEP